MSQWCVSLFEWRIKGVLTLVKRSFMGVWKKNSTGKSKFWKPIIALLCYSRYSNVKGLLCIGFLWIHLVKLVTKVLKIEVTNTSAVSTVS